MQSLGSLNKRFGGLFSKESSELDGGDEPISGGFDRWGWMITLDNLSKEDPTKYPYYYDLNVIEFLTIISYKKSKNEEERRLMELERLKSL